MCHLVLVQLFVKELILDKQNRVAFVNSFPCVPWGCTAGLCKRLTPLLIEKVVCQCGSPVTSAYTSSPRIFSRVTS